MGKENAGLLCQMLVSRSELLRALKGLREDTAWTRPEPNEWSTIEVLHHVADIDYLTVRRLEDFRAGKPDLSGNDPAEWEAERKAAEQDGLPGVLLRLGEGRQELLRAISQLQDADFEKTSSHPRRGRMTARQLLDVILGHDPDHSQQIAKTRAAVER